MFNCYIYKLLTSNICPYSSRYGRMVLIDFLEIFMFWKWLNRKNKREDRVKRKRKENVSKTEDSLDQKIAVFKEGDEIVLAFKKNGDKISLAKSKEGFDFEICQYHPVEEKNKKLQKRKEKLKEFYGDKIAAGAENIDQNKISIQNAFKTRYGHLLFYHYQNKENDYQVGALLFDNENSPIWRHSHPIWQSPDQWKDDKHQFINLIFHQGQYISYWHSETSGIYAAIYPKFKIGLATREAQELKIDKHNQNPIIIPKQENDWENFNTFNPAAVYTEGEVHILYRAQGYNYISSVGYASSKDGVNIDRRLDEPIFRAHLDLKKSGDINYNFVSGGGFGGCEDPRATIIDEKVYMTYVHFDGYSEPRIALTSIKLEDFLNQRWLWEKPVLISPPGVVDKSACILPEKIGGKYVIFHRVFPNILIDFVDNLNFGRGKYLKGKNKIEPRSNMYWDSRKIGAGAPPLKTDRGWLLIYQAVDDKDSGKYLVGAMLLDLEDPTKVLYRSKSPIIEPDMWYDNEGFKAGVVYPCGAVIIDDTLFVYYGGADSHVCVATSNLDKFLDQLKSTGKPEIEPAKIKKNEQANKKK